MKSKLIGLFVMVSMFTGCGFEVVDTGFRGLETRFGEIIGKPLSEGIYWYNPFTTDIVEIDVREQKSEVNAACFTRDTQTVNVQMTLTYYPDPSNIGDLYKQFGRDWADKIVTPVALSSIKDVTGQYIADDLVAKREITREAAFEAIKKTLASRGVFATRLDLTNLDFNDAYETAVEAKVVATQKAAEAKNKTVEVEEEAKQKIIAAEAEAKSMQIRSAALSQNKSLVEYEAVQKWDGKLPTQMFGNSVPFVNIK